MSAVSTYFKQAIPDPFRIMGLQMRPLSLGRYRLLRRFDCAYVADGETSAHAADLILGVIICSMRCDEFLAFANSGKFSKEVRKWGKRINPCWFLSRIPFVRYFWRKYCCFDLFEKMRLFHAYIQQGSEAPKFWDESGETAASGAHWSHSVEVILRSEVNWSEEEINEQPLSKALADYFKFAETKGLVRLMTEWEIKVIEEAEKLLAKEKGQTWASN